MFVTNLETWSLRSQYRNDFNRILTFIHKVWPDCIVAGGFLTRYIGCEPLGGDIDLYFNSKEQFDCCKIELLNNGCKLVKDSDNISTLITPDNYPIHLIGMRFFSVPRYVIESFDYTACQFAYNFKDLYCGDTSLRDLGQKIIKIVNISNQNPLALTKRLLKYIQRGFTIDDRTLQNFLLNISKMDFSSTEPRPNYSTVVDNPFAEIVQDD